MMDEEVLSINYWKEVRNEFDEIMKDINGIILLTHNSIEFPEILDIIEKIKPNKESTILYLSLIRTYDYMDLVLSTRNLKNKKIVFIDCPSSQAFSSDDDTDECMYRKIPNNFDDIRNIIKEGIEKVNPDMIIIDPITQFIDFSKPSKDDLKKFYVFVEMLNDSINAFQDTFILLCDIRTGVMKHLPKLSTDLILKVEVTKGIPSWKD